MAWFVDITVRGIRAAQRAYTRKWTFLAFFLAVFLISVALLAGFDLLPDASAQTVPAVTLQTTPLVSGTAPSNSSVGQLPKTVHIPAIGLSVTVSDPTTTNIDALDKLLLKGAVHYPTSAKLGQKGNVIIFGHSSYLPIVLNQAYKTFDGIQKLVKGDRITVSSATTAYVYSVDTMHKESTTGTAGVSLDVPGKELTLVTCNSFTGTETDRFVVTAHLVDSYPLGN